jgi:DNA invertase Pin-like site-specific DNA recombinase
MRQAIGYVRVSTVLQGRFDLGLDAQKAAIVRCCEAEGLKFRAQHVEVETGKGSDALDRRPQLAVALAEARRHKCPAVVAKLDSLARTSISSVD